MKKKSLNCHQTPLGWVMTRKELTIKITIEREARETKIFYDYLEKTEKCWLWWHKQIVNVQLSTYDNEEIDEEFQTNPQEKPKASTDT